MHHMVRAMRSSGHVQLVSLAAPWKRLQAAGVGEADTIDDKYYLSNLKILLLISAHSPC